jgi:hypothetical protein
MHGLQASGGNSSQCRPVRLPVFGWFAFVRFIKNQFATEARDGCGYVMRVATVGAGVPDAMRWR